MQSFQLGAGLNLNIADFILSKTMEQPFETQAPLLRFYFYILGSGRWEVRSPYRSGSQSTVDQSDRISTLLFYPRMEGRVCLAGQQRQFHLSICIAPSRLNSYLGGRLASFPQDLRAISEGMLDRGYSHTGPLSHLMHQTVSNLLDCPYTGSMKSLYLETKAMELIVHKLAQTMPEVNPGAGFCGLDRRETDRLQHAREILCRDLENPPGLIDLAHAVGTNHCRLNAGFRALYGTTVFDYLRRMRLTEARRLIQEEGLNVTEAAFKVGYNSISSFSKAFSEYHGFAAVKCRRRGISGPDCLSAASFRAT